MENLLTQYYQWLAGNQTEIKGLENLPSSIYESAGRPFESGWARQYFQHINGVPFQGRLDCEDCETRSGPIHKRVQFCNSSDWSSPPIPPGRDGTRSGRHSWTLYLQLHTWPINPSILPINFPRIANPGAEALPIVDIERLLRRRCEGNFLS